MVPVAGVSLAVGHCGGTSGQAQCKLGTASWTCIRGLDADGTVICPHPGPAQLLSKRRWDAAPAYRDPSKGVDVRGAPSISLSCRTLCLRDGYSLVLFVGRHPRRVDLLLQLSDVTFKLFGRMQSTQNTDGLSPYHPAPAGNAFMLAAFAALIPISLYTGFRYRTLLYTSLMVAGLLVEVIGHASAAFLQFDPINRSLFCLFMIATLWGATLIGSVNYLVLPRVMVIYGEDFSLVSHPAYCSMSFLVLDIFALVFQSAGVTLASHSNTPDEASQGSRILLGGLAIQVTSLVAFLSVYWFFRLKLSRRRFSLDLKYSSVFSSSRFNVWLLCMQISTILLLIRAVLRVAAFSGGLESSLAGSRLATFTLDDAIVLLATMILVAAPAGRAFGPSWEKTSPFASPEGSVDAPFRCPHTGRRRHKNLSISKPYPSTLSFQPLEDSPSYQRPYPAPPPLISPRHKPVYMRPAYDLSPAPAGPLHGSQGSPEYPEPPERRTGAWPLADPDGSRLVHPDSLWA